MASTSIPDTTAERTQKAVPRTCGASQPACWLRRGSSTRAGPMMLFRLSTNEPMSEMCLPPKPVACIPSTSLGGGRGGRRSERPRMGGAVVQRGTEAPIAPDSSPDGTKASLAPDTRNGG